MVVVNVRHEHMGGTRGSDIVSSASDMSVFGLRWCVWGLEPGSGRVGCGYVCVRCETGLFVYIYVWGGGGAISGHK